MECESETEYAVMMMPLFKRPGYDGYWVERPADTGFSNEIKWGQDVWRTAKDAAEARGETVDDDDYYLPIEEEYLLGMLAKAVEEVKAEEEE
jgi:hypothetical protein